MPLIDPDIWTGLARWSQEIAADTNPDTGAVRPCLDWLQDQGVEMTLPRMLVLFAGQAEAYTDGLHQAALAEWLKRTEPNQISDIVDEQGWHCWRWQAVAAVSIAWDAIAERVNLAVCVTLRDRVFAEDIREVVERDGKLYPDVDHVYRWGLRDLKRRVLALFPEVACVDWALDVPYREFDLPQHGETVLRHLRSVGSGRIAFKPGWGSGQGHDGWLTNKLRSEGFKRHIGVFVYDSPHRPYLTFRQTIHAPDLLPPEPAEYGPSPAVQHHRERRGNR